MMFAQPRLLEQRDERIQGSAMSTEMSRPGIASDYTTSCDRPETFSQNAQLCTRALSLDGRQAEKGR